MVETTRSSRAHERSPAGPDWADHDVPARHETDDPGRANHPTYRTGRDDRHPRLPYLPGIDGLRAIAVLAVLCYHAELGFAEGGFLGVEIFFVISGYLITALLLAERRASGGISLGRFYLRRARRLLPALLVLVAVVAAIAVVFLPDEVATLRGDLVASLGYVTNWFFIAAEKSYFEISGRPSLVQHLWSLAIEEQFYLVWPLLFALASRFLKRGTFVLLIVAGALASTALMAALYVPGADPSRVYYGTDTRSSALLWGAALAFVWSPWRLRTRTGRGAPALLDSVGFLALVGLLATLGATSEFSDALYRGGFLRTALLTTVVIAVAAHPAARLGRVLGMRPLRWVGLRSYGIYLFHWPVFMLTRPGVDIPWTGPLVEVARFGLAIGLAALSYRYVERPVRSGALGRWWRGVRAGAPRRVRPVALTTFATMGAVVLVAVAVGRAQFPETPDYLTLSAGPAQAAALPAPSPSTTAPGPDPAATGTEGAPGESGSAAQPGAGVDPAVDPATGAVDPAAEATTTTVPDPTATTTAPPTTAAPAAAPPVATKRVTLLGDSVMLGAAPALQANLPAEVFVDAVVGRQVSEGIAILRQWRDLGFLGDVVVVHLGNNGTFSAEQFAEMREVLAGVPKVVFLTCKVPRRWEESVNQVITEGVNTMPNAVLIDWYHLTVERPELFWDDAMHLRPDGAAYYSELVAASL